MLDYLRIDILQSTCKLMKIEKISRANETDFYRLGLFLNFLLKNGW